MSSTDRGANTETEVLTDGQAISENPELHPQEETMEYEVGPDPEKPERWVAQAIDWDREGEVYTALFIGRDAEARARQYADWQNAALRTRKVA